MSTFATQIAGPRLTLEGLMAPPLQAESHVPDQDADAVCPFCETETEWPNDILAIHTKPVVEVLSYNIKIEARGMLEMGSYRNPEIGFFSLVRLTDATCSEA